MASFTAVGHGEDTISRTLSMTLSAWVALGVAGCGSSEPEGLDPVDPGQGSTPTARPAPSAELSIRFLISERPHDPSPEWVEADEGRWVDPLRVVIEGLGEGESVRLETSLGSWAELVGDSSGAVDLATSVPLAGSWGTADADGVFWSAPPSGQPSFEVEFRVQSLADPERAASRSYRRLPLNEGVDATPLDDGTTVGVLARPSGIAPGEKRPGVLVFGGSEGGTGSGELQAYYLAQLGYVTMGVGYFAAPGLPADLDRVPLEILETDLSFLAAQPDVDPSRIAVMGGSRGGELALILGAYFPESVHAVVAQVPSGYVWGSLAGGGTSAWTYQEEELPFIPSGGGWPDSYYEDGELHYVLTPMFQHSVENASEEARAAATIEVDRTSGPILLLGAEEDALWPSCELSQVSWDLLAANEHRAEHPDAFHCLSGAGHAAVGLVGLSTLESEAYYSPENQAWMDLGGTPEANGRAQRQSNTITREFLETALSFQEDAK